jgi:hypothetical protein
MTSDQPPPAAAPAQDQETAREQGQASPPEAEPHKRERGAPEETYAAETVSPWSEPGSAPPSDSRPARRGWLPLAAGVIGGIVLLGALAAGGLWAFDRFTLREEAARSLDARLKQIEQRVAELGARPVPSADTGALRDLTNRTDRLEAAVAAPRPGATDPALANRIAALEGQVKVLSETVGTLSTRGNEALAAGRTVVSRVEANAAALTELNKRLGEQSPAVTRSDFDALATRLAAVERGDKPVDDRAARLALAASVLNSAVERGAPFAAQLAIAKALAPDPKTLAPLEPFVNSGVPSAAALSRQLAMLVPSLRAAAGEAPREAGVFDRLAANAEKLVRIHPLQEVAGSEPAAIISRIEVKATHNDIPGALAELTQLPAPVRAPAEAWVNQAQGRTAALDASHRLAADSLAGLSK